jgi:hypothetical protein
MMLYDCYYYYCHFLSKYHCFLQCKIRFFLKVIRNPHQNHYDQLKYRYILHLRMNEMLPKKEKILMNDLFYLEIIILLRKSQLVTSYSLKLDVNRCF